MSGIPGNPAANLEGLLQGLASLAEEAPVEPASRPSSPSESAHAGGPRRRIDCGAARRVGDGGDIGLRCRNIRSRRRRSLEDIHVGEAEIASIILRLMGHRGTATGVEIAQHIGLPFPVTEKVLNALRHERLLVFRNAAMLNDYLYEITDLGLSTGRLSVQCSYCGPCPSRCRTTRPAWPRSRWAARGHAPRTFAGRWPI